MEGARSLKQVNVYKRLPFLYLGMFCIGGLLEVVFCSTNFYQIYNVGESEKKADDNMQDMLKRYEIRQKIKESLFHMSCTLCLYSYILFLFI